MALTGGGYVHSRKRRIPAVVLATTFGHPSGSSGESGEGFVESQAQGSIGLEVMATSPRATDSVVEQDPEVGACGDDAFCVSKR